MNKDKSYEDIRNVEYPVKTSRGRMSMHDRAAQFSPFAALTGYDELIGETIKKNEQSIESIDLEDLSGD